VIGSNRPRLYATMLAAQSLGAIPIPLYQDAAGAECVFPLNNAEVRFAVVEDQEQVDKLLEIREQCPQIARIFFDDPRGLRKYDEPGLASVEELLAAGAVFAKQHPDFFLTEVEKAHTDDVGKPRTIGFDGTIVVFRRREIAPPKTRACSGRPVYFAVDDCVPIAHSTVPFGKRCRPGKDIGCRCDHHPAEQKDRKYQTSHPSCEVCGCD
jgi:hypothetical protein